MTTELPAEQARLRRVRVAPLPLEERRRAILAATRPLLLDHGPNVSTRQIAEAAGVAEGTIFRAFETKADLVQAVLEEALSPDATITELGSIPTDLDLPETIARIVEVLQDGTRRVRSLLAAVSGPECAGSRPAFSPKAHFEREHAVAETVISLLARFDDDLRVSPRAAAWAIKAFAFAAVHPLTDDPAMADPHLVSSLILNGISHRPC